MILQEARAVVRTRPPLVIAETQHGFVCASAGVDASNAKGLDTLVLLPVDPDASATRLRDRIRELVGVELGVIVSDSFGRAWRLGTTDVALGVAGVTAVLDLDGALDDAGYELHATQIAVADEIAAPHSSSWGSSTVFRRRSCAVWQFAATVVAATSSCLASETCFVSAD